MMPLSSTTDKGVIVQPDKLLAQGSIIGEWICISFFKYTLLIMLLQFSQFFPFYPLSAPHPPSLPLSSCPWVVHINSLSYLFPIPFLTSPHLFNAYQLCFFFPVPFPPYSCLPSPHWNPSMWCPFLWFCSCSSCLLSFCFHCFSFIFSGSFVDSCEFVVILLFILFFLFR